MVYGLWSKSFGKEVLGGELPTNRGCGLVHPSDLHGIFVGLIHINHWGELRVITHLRCVGSSPPSRYKSINMETGTLWNPILVHAGNPSQSGIPYGIWVHPTGVTVPAKYPLVNIQKTMENHNFLWINPL